MRQEQERFRSYSLNRGVDTNPPRGWNRIDTSGETGLLQRHSGETHSAGRLENQERWRFWTSQNDEERIKDSRENKEKDVPRKTYVQKPDRFEPFINQEPQEEYLFVNNYGGAYSQKMELNRRGVERSLKIAHLDGKVFLTTLSPSRSRAEAQGNELVAKRFLFFGEKTQKAEEENPYKRVVSVPEGWRIEINDQRITEELAEKGLGGEELQKAFIGEFNRLVKKGIRECVWREKLTGVKDGAAFIFKLIPTSGIPSVLFSWASYDVASRYYPAKIAFAGATISTFVAYGIFNFLSRSRTSPIRREIDHLWEYFMPPVEIDKVARTFGYFAGKGRRLVREVGEKQ